jgi:hypothetical protein
MYYLWLNEAQAGPYDLQQVQSMWKAGQITAETLCWQEGNAEWQPFSTILPGIEPKKRAASPMIRTAVIRPFEQTMVRRTGNLTNPKPVVQAAQQPEPVPNTPEPAQGTGQSALRKWAPLLILSVIVIVLLILGLIYFA